ncbi:expressed unknown protein [Seminavis robusta]|uniref:Uncharacterized protein n=1 Tax=Seminavis robusta TaxID=568900 RepID=A0A9N8EWN1_9STRA|nr:expressed unknown protein [Seminavis robusta]|eukprot:Sro2272_g321460.1 n/a (358) ;mRNA; r:5597-6918
MDNRGVKRPRSSTPGGDDSTTKNKKDKLKKKKKNKPNPKKPESKDETTNSLEETATADGRHMAKLLSTFSKIEMSRFEAFKRVSFPCDAISDYVAHCLATRQGALPRPQPVGKFLNFDNQQPRLEDLVVPGQQEEITTVVATLAKAYAQRLVAAAKVVKQQQQQSAEETSKSGETTSTASSNSNNNKETAIQPEHVLQAFYARRQQGQDPGFFLQANECINIATQPMDNNNAGKEQMKLVAALAAQEECDKTFKEYKEAYEKRKLDESKRKADNESNKEKANNDTEMKEEKMNTEMKESDEEKPATTTTEVKAPAAEEATTNNATTKPEDTTKTTTTKPEDSDSGDDDEIDLEMDED